MTYADNAAQLNSADIDLVNKRTRSRTTLEAEESGFNLANASYRSRLLYARRQSTITRYKSDPRNDALALLPIEHQGFDVIDSSRDGLTTFYASRTETNRTEFLAEDPDRKLRHIVSVVGLVIDPRLTPDDKAILFLHADDKGRPLSVQKV